MKRVAMTVTSKQALKWLKKGEIERRRRVRETSSILFRFFIPIGKRDCLAHLNELAEQLCAMGRGWA